MHSDTTWPHNAILSTCSVTPPEFTCKKLVNVEGGCFSRMQNSIEAAHKFCQWWCKVSNGPFVTIAVSMWSLVSFGCLAATFVVSIHLNSLLCGECSKSCSNLDSVQKQCMWQPTLDTPERSNSVVLLLLNAHLFPFIISSVHNVQLIRDEIISCSSQFCHATLSHPV